MLRNDPLDCWSSSIAVDLLYFEIIPNSLNDRRSTMQQLEEYGLEPLTDEEQTAVNGGETPLQYCAIGLGALASSVWWLMKAGGSALDLEYMHL
jgi:hypothetical protein